MAAIHGAQNLTVFFCDDPDHSFRDTLTGFQGLSKAFEGRSVLRHDHNEVLRRNSSIPQNERNEMSAKLLAVKVYEIYTVFQKMGAKGCRYRFLLFARGGGVRILDLALKELSIEKSDISVYVFGGAVEISTQLAGKVCHYSQASNWDETVLQIAKEET